MKAFKELISNHYYNIFVPKQEKNKKTNPMNFHPWSFQFYKCNPIKTFECIIKDIDTCPNIAINSYIAPSCERDNSLKPLPMPSTLLKKEEWKEIIKKANYAEEIQPLIDNGFLKEKGLGKLTKCQFAKLPIKDKAAALPFLDQNLRDMVPLRPIVSALQKKHYQRG